MFRTLPILVALMSGCHMADARNKPEVEPFSSSWDGLSRNALVQVDTRGTAQSLHLLLQDAERASMVERAKTADAVRVLATNCPYTRASFQLPYVLRAVVSEIHVRDVDPLIREEWGYLQLGLAKHVALLDAYDLDLGEPPVGDYLHGRAEVLTLEELKKAADPVAAMQAYVDAIPTLVADMDTDVTPNRLIEANTVADGLLGQATLGRQLGGWENTLRRVEPFASDPETGARLRALIELLQSWGGQGC